MISNVKLVATDLDGTLIGSANELPLYSDFRTTIHELREKQGTLWAACTGRSRRSFNEFFTPMRQMNIMPDYIIINHAFISERKSMGYVPHYLWNMRIRKLIWATRVNTGHAIEEWHDLVTGMAMGVRTLRREKSRLHLRFDSPESADTAANVLRERVARFPHLRVFQYQREVDVRHVPFTKGLALSELANQLEIGRENILAIGNGHNDISMLDGSVAACTGCPANSDAEVMETVHASGGHIASGRSLAGVMEVLDAYRNSTVNSDLPSNWIPSSDRKNPWPNRRQKHRTRPNLKKLWWGSGIAYAVILVFASFDILPFSGLIMKPYTWLMTRIGDLLVRLMQ